MPPVASDNSIRPGEIAVTLPERTDAGVYFIGRIRTPWQTRRECPRRGALDGPICSIEVDARWAEGLTGIEAHPRIQVLYWMHEARRDLVLQRPGIDGFDLCHVRLAVSGAAQSDRVVGCYRSGAVRHGLRVRGLDCIDGTPLIDLKPERGAAEAAGH